MNLISTLAEYFKTINRVHNIDSTIATHQWSIERDRYSWEVFDAESKKLEIAELEKERENIVALEVKELQEFLKNLSTNYYVFSSTEPKVRQIHRSNCEQTNRLKNGKFDYVATYNEAATKATEIRHNIQWEWSNGCSDCKPYLDVDVLNAEIENYYKK